MMLDGSDEEHPVRAQAAASKTIENKNRTKHLVKRRKNERHIGSVVRFIDDVSPTWESPDCRFRPPPIRPANAPRPSINSVSRRERISLVTDLQNRSLTGPKFRQCGANRKTLTEILNLAWGFTLDRIRRLS